ncbi:MAG: 4Fe-4S cluster-binding domain-containing protein [Oscillospiraceae bacterium]
MRIKDIVDEDFINYNTPSMFIALGECNWKCCIEANIPTATCQNSKLAKQKNIEISESIIFERYVANKITHSIVIGGLETMTMFSDIVSLISYFRRNNVDDYFVIFTGYYENEILEQISELAKFKNIIVKFGRYKPNQIPHLDKILGVNLVSDNQYAKTIS